MGRRLGIALAIAIPAIGIPTLLLTRLLAWLYQPQLFERTLPSISKTAAFAPGSWVFATGMMLTAAAIILAWPIGHALNRRAIDRLAPASAAARLRRLNSAAMLAGIAAGCALGALAIVTLETDDPLHVRLSKFFFTAQILALLGDTLLAQRLNRLTGARYAISGGVFLSALLFLVIFLVKDTGLIPHPMLVRWMYVVSENVLCILFFVYSLTYLPALREPE